MKLMRFVDSMGDEDRKENVALVLWRNDPMLYHYSDVLNVIPRTWEVYIGPERSCGAKLNAMFHTRPNEDFYGFLSDDVEIGTPNMLPILAREAVGGKFAWPNDGVHEIRMSSHPVAPGKLIRALGWWAHPEFPHNGLDLVLYRVANALDICAYMSDLRLIVRHPSLLNGEKDDTHIDAEPYNALWEKRRYEFEERDLPHLIKRVKVAYGQATAN